MKSFLNVSISVAVVVRLWMAGVACAQGQPLPESVTDPYFSVKEPALHKALTTLSELRLGAPQTPAAPETKARLSELYARPDVRSAMGVVLSAAETMNTSSMPAAVQNSFSTTIKAAVASGSEEYVPTLKKLAHHSQKQLRDSVADVEAHAFSKAPNVEILRETILSAEERLPPNLKDRENSQAAANEFYDRVQVFVLYASPAERASITAQIETFLKKYDSAFEDYYRPKLEKLLGGAATTAPGKQGSGQMQMGTRQATGAGSSSGTSSEPPKVPAKHSAIAAFFSSFNVVWVALPVLVLLLWALAKKRR